MKRFELKTGEFSVMRTVVDADGTVRHVHPEPLPSIIVVADEARLGYAVPDGPSLAGTNSMVTFWIGGNLSAAYGVTGNWHVREYSNALNEAESILSRGVE